jgi:hypothetical protein
MTQLDFTPLHNSPVMQSFYRENPYPPCAEPEEDDSPHPSPTTPPVARSEHFQFQQIQQRAVEEATRLQQEEKRTERHLKFLRDLSGLPRDRNPQFVYYYLPPDSPTPARTDKSLNATFLRYAVTLFFLVLTLRNKLQYNKDRSTLPNVTNFFKFFDASVIPPVV